MGRPIKKKYFGNTNTGGVGGEGVASVTVYPGTVSSGTITVVFGSPNLAGGTSAVGTAVKTGNTVTSVLMVSPGGGYTSVPSVTYTGTNMTSVGTSTAVLTTTNVNAIAVSAFLPLGASAKASDIINQRGSKRYLVQNSDGTGICKLVGTTATLVASEMRITATDSGAGTYYVTKLTAHKATLAANTGTQFTTGRVVGWNLTAAVAGLSVLLSNN